MEPYKINESFTVIPQSNLINELKLEPRLMKLLCLLTDTPGKLITRDEIVDKIWNGYGGGDEGLTQAISFLRKILNDTGKTIIETVPKSGYIFHGTIEKLDTHVMASPAVHAPGPARRINVNLIIIFTVIVLSLIALLIYQTRSNTHFAPKADKTVTPAPSSHFAPKAK